MVLETRITDYPDEPLLGQEISGDVVGPDRGGGLVNRSEDLKKFTSDEVSDMSIVGQFFHQSHESLDNDAQLGANVLRFGSNNSGITSRRLLTFIWSIDGDGAIVVRFANGDEIKCMTSAPMGQI